MTWLQFALIEMTVLVSAFVVWGLSPSAEDMNSALTDIEEQFGLCINRLDRIKRKLDTMAVTAEQAQADLAAAQSKILDVLAAGVTQIQSELAALLAAKTDAGVPSDAVEASARAISSAADTMSQAITAAQTALNPPAPPADQPSSGS